MNNKRDNSVTRSVFMFRANLSLFKDMSKVSVVSKFVSNAQQ